MADWHADCKIERLYVQTKSAQRPGGQHAGSPTTYIRITHVPTDTVAECSYGRSEHSNRQIAMLMLEVALVEMKIL